MMTQTYCRWTVLLLIAVGSALVPGCSGLRVAEKGRYFTTERASDLELRNISSIGVYVFSKGAPIDGSSFYIDGADVLTSAAMFPMTLAKGTDTVGGAFGIRKHYYPPRIELSSTFKPDTANAGPSLELANVLKERLGRLGYTTTVVTDMPHSGQITVASCLEHARDHGFDAAFIVYYAGLRSWLEFGGRTYLPDMSSSLPPIGGGPSGLSVGASPSRLEKKVIDGYLYLPNAAMFEVGGSHDLLWRNSYYGIVERAYLPNLSGEPFTELVNEVVKANGDSTSSLAAVKAANVLLSPDHWVKSFKEIPPRKEARKEP